MEINVIGSQRELHPKHLFLVHVDPSWSAGFQKMSELSAEAAKIEYWEGASLIPWKIPGRVTIPEVTLSRGSSNSRAFYFWFLQVANTTVGGFPTRGKGDKVPTYMKQIYVDQLDRDADENKPLARYRLHNAWCSKYVAGEWDNTVDEVVIESITIAFDFWTREPA